MTDDCCGNCQHWQAIELRLGYCQVVGKKEFLTRIVYLIETGETIFGYKVQQADREPPSGISAKLATSRSYLCNQHDKKIT